jgi:serine/threonine protein kinase/tetratricopeptide (TPR) repeat protein
MDVHSTSETGTFSHGATQGPPRTHGFERPPIADAGRSHPAAPHFWGELARNDPRVIAALEAYLEALRAGRPWSRADFLTRYADIAEPLAECLSGLEFIEAAAVQLDSKSPEVAQPLSESIPASAQLGDYRILGEVGRGGMGVVYEAQQISLGRRVALKVLPFAAAIDPRQRQRFQIEAQAAAQLHHPHIVPIFSVGCDHGIHYYAMQFVEGRSLAAILQDLRSGEAMYLGEETGSVPGISAPEAESASASEHGDRGKQEQPAHAPGAAHSTTVAARRAQSSSMGGSIQGSSSSGQWLAASTSGSLSRDRSFFRNVARVGAEVAEALEHAHGLGILHRDIKPANLLIDRDDSVWITDFGLARFPSDLSLTQTGDLVGTLRYMSPEQAVARRGVVDQRTDIYSLGVTLYELLTLRPAFDGRDHQELLRQIALDEPIPPRRINPAVPRDLETIILKATAKEPSSRYSTAQELAADLRRFQDDQPILARRPGAVERTLRWMRRRKELVATTVATAVLALLIGTAVTLGQARQIEASNRRNQAYIIETFPLLDRLAMQAMADATKLITGTADAETRESSVQIYQEALGFYRHASALPPAELESRKIIARAYKQLGFTRGMLSGANSASSGPDSSLLAQAESDYRHAIDLYKKLMAESPGDRKVRRHFAEALGTWGCGWLLRFTNRAQEAEPYYHQAVGLWRELVQEIGSHDGGSPAPDSAGAELSDLIYLADTVHMLAAMLDGRGKTQEAKTVRNQLVEDVTALTARLTGHAGEERRRKFARQFVLIGHNTLAGNNRPVAALTFRLAMILDPENGEAHNGVAWILVSVPCDPAFDPAHGLPLAKKAVALAPEKWTCWNTLGVAAYRMGDWKTAAECLLKSTSLTGGGAVDWFFLAMTRWNQGQKQEAREWFDRAVESIKKDTPTDFLLNELLAFHAEAANLMGLPGPKLPVARQRVERGAAPSDTAQKNPAQPKRHEKG